MTKIVQKEYKEWLLRLKSTIKSSQLKAAVAVNSQLILLYFELGRMIVEKQEASKWGSKLIPQIASDLKKELPDVGGFSRSNLYAIRKFYLFYRNEKSVQQAVGQLDNIPLFQIPWGHHVMIINKCSKVEKAFFYIEKTIENNWSRAVLEYQIETNLFGRQGKAINNFENTLPQPNSDLAKELLKNPYNFEFLSLSEHVKEKELEHGLVENITQFLLELGKGFAYMGKQFLMKIGSKEYRTDLLFYHTKLRAYIVIELKVKEFQPEFVGKLNFYISAINELVKAPEDKPTIGILLCKNKDDFEVEFALKDVNKPIGVSEFTYKELPEDIKKGLPTEKEFNEELKNLK